MSLPVFFTVPLSKTRIFGKNLISGTSKMFGIIDGLSVNCSIHCPF